MSKANIPAKGVVAIVFEHPIKIGAVALAIAFSPGILKSWQIKHAQEQLATNQKTVHDDASIAGMMLMNAATKCYQIGILNDLDGCAKHKATLIQEKAAPELAKLAIQQRDSYMNNCKKFYESDYCSNLLLRSVAISNAQSKGNHD